jgi:hypothetical protein
MEDQGTPVRMLALIEQSSRAYRRLVTDRFVPRWWDAAEQPRDEMLQHARAVRDAELMSAVEALAAMDVARDQPLPPSGFDRAYARVWRRTLELRLGDR